MGAAQPGIPVLRAALTCRCPRCGKGRLLRGLMTVRDRCEVCGLDLRQVDTGDGPVFFVMFFLCILIVGLAFWVELAFRPPIWVHVALWPPVTAILAVVLMRPATAALVAMQYRTRASEMGL
jgi:uncharacterized protein (DUF983 family)